MLVLAALLHIAPWSGASLPTASPAAAKYKLTVEGKPHEVLTLRANGVPRGWIASFCTPQFCAPFRLDTTLSGDGRAVFEVALIRVSARGPARVIVSIGADGSNEVTATAPTR